MLLLRFVLTVSLLCSVAKLSMAQQTFGQSISTFSTDLFAKVASNFSGNIIVSPFSVQTTLSLLYCGAAGQTAVDMTTALKLSTVATGTTVASIYQTLLSTMQNNAMLMSANKIYIQQGYSVNPTFAQIAAQSFYSSAEPINFAASSAAAKTMNKWVESKTNNLIKDLISPDSLDSLTRMVLINAIYFKGAWAKQFKASQTIDAQFNRTNLSSALIKTMKITDRFNYIEDANLNAKIIELPYKSSTISMFVFLPNDYEGVSDLQSKLKTYDLTKVTTGMTSQRVALSLPKFQISFPITLNDILSQMGMGRIFDDSADFSQLIVTPERLKVTKVVQKAYINLNEAGTEAAAATGTVVTALTSVFYPEPPKNFNADHPFVYTIQDRVGAVFFMGRFSNSG